MAVVIVDDASESPVRAPEVFPLPLTLLRQPRRAGANAARRRGLAAAEAEFVHFHDSDDGVLPGWTGAVLAALDAAPETDVFVTRRVDEIDGHRLPAAQSFFERACRDPRRVARALLLRNVLGPFGGVVFSRRALASTTFPDFASSQDWAVYREVYRSGRPIRGGAAPAARFLYRRSGTDRISASPRRKTLGMFGLLRMERGRPFVSLLRLHHLHYFGTSLRACRRRGLDRALVRTRLTRPVAYALALVYLVVVLRRL